MTFNYLDAACEALEALDSESLVSHYAAAFTFDDPGLDQHITKHAELRAYFDALFRWPEAAFRDVVSFSTADRGAAQWTWTARARGSGRPFTIRGASIFELSPGGITRETIYYDPRPAMVD